MRINCEGRSLVTNEEFERSFCTRCSMFDVQYSMFDIRCPMFDARCSIFNIRYPMFNVGSRIKYKSSSEFKPFKFLRLLEVVRLQVIFRVQDILHLSSNAGSYIGVPHVSSIAGSYVSGVQNACLISLLEREPSTVTECRCRFNVDVKNTCLCTLS